MCEEQTELVAALDAGPFEEPLWSTFLAMLQDRVKASYAGIFFRPLERPWSSSVHLFSAKGASPKLLKLFQDGVDWHDPLAYFQLPEGEVRAVADLIDPKIPAHQEFFRHALVPRGLQRGRIVRVTEPLGLTAWLSIARDQPDFTAADGELLGSLVPSFRRSLRSYAAIERERFRVSVTADAMQRLDFGWLSLDVSGRVIEMSAHAERLLQRSGHLSRSGNGRLTAAQRAIDRQLTETLKHFAADASVRPRALKISHDPWLDMLLIPAPERIKTTASRPVAIAYLHGDDRSEADRHEQLAELFGLLPSEARLALALSRGLTMAEAAAHLGVTEGTARSYSKKIYAKMGARGQTDLIRFILTSVLALA